MKVIRITDLAAVAAIGVLIAAALLALMLTSAGSAAGSPSTLGTGPSGFASLSTSTASANCSKAAAREVVERLGMSISEPSADPIGKVLCGAFTGPGSQAMVVMLRGPGNTGFVDWAVFRWAGGTWQFVMKQPAGASITAAGSDIRQTLPIYRPADSRCCPTGGTKTRLWRWNGTRFTAGPWKQVTPAAAQAGVFTSGYFRTPSGNIQCVYGYGKGPGFVQCGIKSGLKPPPPRRGPACTQSNRVSLDATGRTSTGRSICPGEDEGDSGPFAPFNVSRVLGYGKTWSGGGLSCKSAVTGLTCRNKSGHGFFLSTAHWRAF